MEDRIIGPALPDNISTEFIGTSGPTPENFLDTNTVVREPTLHENLLDDKNVMGPVLPKNFSEETVKVIGPTLSESVSKNIKIPNAILSERIQKENSKIIGPVLPPNFSSNKSNEDNEEETSESNLYGPQLPRHWAKKQTVEVVAEESDDDDVSDVIGPLPVHLVGGSSTHQALKERAEILKHNYRNKIVDEQDEVAKREAWMTELPPENTHIFGTGSRKFKANSNETKPGRSLWTDTPNSKRKHETTNEPDIFETSVIQKRNEIMDEIVKKSKKHKKEKKTLLEIHQEKLKKKQKEDAEKEQNERKPFDRDLDLHVSRFDEAQKRSIISKAQLLDSRFKTGRSKYL